MGLSADDAYARWCLDEACYLWGQYIEGELEEVSRRHKKSKGDAVRLARKGRLEAILAPRPGDSDAGPQTDAQAPKTGFQDPAELGVVPKKIKRR